MAIKLKYGCIWLRPSDVSWSRNEKMRMMLCESLVCLLSDPVGVNRWCFNSPPHHLAALTTAVFIFCSWICNLGRSQWGQLVSVPCGVSRGVLNTGVRIIWRFTPSLVWPSVPSVSWNFSWGCDQTTYMGPLFIFAWLLLIPRLPLCRLFNFSGFLQTVCNDFPILNSLCWIAPQRTWVPTRWKLYLLRIQNSRIHFLLHSVP